MMLRYEKKVEQDFTENGGIRERMTAARLGYRNIQKAQLDEKDREIARLKAEITRLQSELDELREAIAGGGD
jgi:flagellar motility protein MotE (MotC chaperone)